MRCHTSLLLMSWLVAVTAAAPDSFTYSFDQRDVKPLKPQRKPIVKEPLRKREDPMDYASHNHLFPAIHPHLDKRDVRHLHRRQDHSLFYTKNGGIHLEDADMVATLDATFHWEAVVLDHSAFVKNVTCQPEQMSIELDSLKNLNTARTNWTGDTIVFVSSAKTCHTTFPGQFGFFNTSSITYDQNTLTATAKGKQVAVEHAIREFNVVWGQWEAAGKPKKAQQAAADVLAASSLQTSSTRSSSSSTPKRSSTSSASQNPAVAAARIATTSSSRTGSTTRTRTTPTKSTTTSKRSTTTSKRSTTTSKRSTTTSKKSTTKSTRTTTKSTRSGMTASTTSLRSSSSTSSTSSATTTSTDNKAGILPAVPTSSSSTTREAFETLVAPTGTGICGVVPSAVPSGISQYFKQVSCDNNFDKSVDKFFTYLRDVANLNPYLRLWAPNTGITSADIPQSGSNMVLTRRGYVERRGFLGFLKGVVRVLKAIVDVVIAVVKAVVAAVRQLAESLLPTWSPSISFTIPVALEPNKRLLDECPWGEGGFELWKWKPDEGASSFDPLSFDSLAKMTGADQILTFKIDGVEQLPEPGVTVWCVDCGIHGSIYTTGSATFTVIGPTRLSVRLRGDLNANVQLGVNGFYKFERPILEIPLTPDIGLPGFSIAGVITVGPYLTVDLVAKIEVETVGQVLAGVNLDWPELGMLVDFMSPLSSKSYGFSPIVTPVFKASGEISATASLGIPIGVNVGIKLLNVWEKAIALVDTPAIQAVAEYSASYDNQAGGQSGGDECDGIYFYSNVVNSLELEVPWLGAYELGKWEGPKFIEGCVGDKGVTTVKQLEQPADAGQTKAGCKLVDNVFRNGDFSNGASFWTPLVGHDNADMGVKAEGTNNELSVNRRTFDTGGCVFTICPGTCLASGECAGGCDSACPQPQGPWKFTVSQDVDLCTYSQYNAELSGRIERFSDRTSCKVTKWFLKGADTNSMWLQREFIVDQPILPKTSQNPGNLVIGDPNKPIAITIPSKDNVASYKVRIGVEVECTSDDFDVRLDDFQLTPDASAYMKRDLQAMNRMMVHPDLATIHRPSSLQARQVPVIPEGNAVPMLPGANGAPTVALTVAASVIPAANAAPTLPPNLEAPAKTYVPGGNLVGGHYTLGAAIPTATAVFIGPNKYKFPAFSDIMASATIGVVGAAPTAGSGLPYTGWSSLTNYDPRQKSRLATADDGNLYMVADNGGPSPGTQFFSEDSIAYRDEAERMFHYFPATMNAYGVSRLRVAQVLDTPLGAQMITLVPVETGQGVAYVAADTDGHNYLLAWCSAPRWQGSKVFLVSDYEKGLPALLSGDVQWIVTGNNVTECDPLVLTSQAGGLIPT